MGNLVASISLNELIGHENSLPEGIKTIHLLTDKLDKFIIAITWTDVDGNHFKMFKQQDHSTVVTFGNSLSEHNSLWSEEIKKWLDSPRIPLKLNAE